MLEFFSLGKSHFEPHPPDKVSITSLPYNDSVTEISGFARQCLPWRWCQQNWLNRLENGPSTSASLYPSEKKGAFNKEGECDSAHVMKTREGEEKVGKSTTT